MPIVTNIPNINAVALWRIQDPNSDDCITEDLGLIAEGVEDNKDEGLVWQSETSFCDHGLITEAVA